MPYKVKDIKLAPQGVKKIEWVQKHMPVLETIKKRFKKEKPFEESPLDLPTLGV